MSDLFHRFKDSMVIDYEKWHDGVGYDIDLISQMTESDRQSVEDMLLQKGVSDWRDLEALQALGTARALEVIEEARKGENAELRLYAMRYGNPPETNSLEAEIVAGLDSDEGIGKAIDLASECPTQAVKEKLIEVARTANLPHGYSAAAMLFEIAGIIDSHWDMTHRDFFLRFSAPPGPERDQAAAELRKKIGM